MGLRFQKRVQLFPGVRLNFSRSGISATLGVRGASMTVGRDGVYANLGLPGSGLSYREKVLSFPRGGRADQGTAPQAFQAGDSEPVPSGAQPIDPTLPQIASAPLEEVSSAGLAELHRLILEAGEQRRALKGALVSTLNQLKKSEKELASARVWWRKLFVGKRIPALQEQCAILKAETQDLEKTLAASVIDLDLDLDQTVLDSFILLARAFDDLRTSAKIWDVTHQRDDGRLDGKDVNRRPVHFAFADSALLKCQMRAMMFGNANGSDMHLYPMFVLMRSQGDTFALVDPRDIVISYEAVSFVEDQPVPADTRVIGEGFENVTKSGERDRRFARNRTLPTVLYGSLSVYSRAGLNERWLISNPSFAERFSRAWAAYQRVLPPLEGQGYFGNGPEE